MVATRRSGSRSTMASTRFRRGVVTVFMNSRLNLSPHQPASSTGAGMESSLGACMVDTSIFF